MAHLTAGRARTLARDALLTHGVSFDDATVTAESLVEAELEGQPTHGLMRLPFLLARLREGAIDIRPRLAVAGDHGAALLLDAGNALGPVAGLRATRLAVERAAETGVALVAVRHGNHLGSLGLYLHRIAAHGMAGLVMSNTPPAIAPPGARTAFLGTNPIAAGFPTSGDPVLVDMATTQVARGKLLRAAAAGEPIPEGWALDAEGTPTTDPRAGLEGSLLPLGGDKGFALALMVECLTGVLAGAAIGPDVVATFSGSGRPSNVGHCFVAIDVEAVAPGFRDRLEAMLADIRRLGGRAPGDRRHAARARHLEGGIDVEDSLVAKLTGSLDESP